MIEIDPLDNTLDAFEILINYDDFLQHLKLESEIYAPKNGRKFVISLDEAFIGINFVMGYLKLTNPSILLGNRKSFRFNKLCSQRNDKGEI